MRAVFQKIPRFVPVLIGLALFGIIRAPFEERAEKGLVDSGMLLPPPGLSAMDQLSQSALMGTLGGLRSLVATYLVLEAYDHFSNKDWDELRNTYNVVVALEPYDESNWVSATWHLGINATANMELDTKLPKFERDRRFREYAFQGIDFAERGMEQLPNSYAIPVQLAEIYREKLRDNCATARVYKIAKDVPGAPGYLRRFYGYFLARCPGSEKEAYDFLTGLYREGDYQHKPTLIKEIKNLEKKLDIPFSLRISDPDPDEARLRQMKQSGPLPGGISVP